MNILLKAHAKHLFFGILIACFGNHRASHASDMSLAPSYNTPTGGRIILISYASGEVYERNQNCLALSAINSGIDTIVSYRRKHINDEFYQKHKNILDLPRGAGYWLWKPYFILETLKAMSPNDILLYIDSGMYIKGTIEPILKLLSKPFTDMVMFKNDHTNFAHIKRDTFDIMEVDYDHRTGLHLDASFMAIKKTKFTQAFMGKWLEYCTIEENITDSPSKIKEFDEFEDHRHDQAILTLLYLKWLDPAIEVLSQNIKSQILSHHRRRSSEQPMKIMLQGLRRKKLSRSFSNHK